LTTPEKPVFYDPVGRRWRRVRRTYLALAVVATAVAAVFIASVFVKPLLPNINLRAGSQTPKQPIKIEAPKLPALPINPRDRKAKKAQDELDKALAKTHVVPARHAENMPIAPPPVTPPPVIPKSRPLAIGFYVSWDESSLASLERNLDHLDWVVPQWVHLQDPAKDGSPIAVELHAPALNRIRETRPQIRILPMVQNLVDDVFNKDLLNRAIADDGSRQRLVAALSAFVQQNNFAGVCIDFEEVPDTSLNNLLLFMQSLHAAFQVRGWTVMQSVPFDSGDWKYKDFAAATDYLVLMAYDEHYAGKEWGSVAGQEWYVRNLAARMSEIDPAKTIIAIGNYGYDWTEGAPTAKELTCQEALITARESDVEQIQFDAATLNPNYEYDEDDNTHHHVWFLDAVTAYNQMRAASGYNPAGFALWRLGSEDPSIWSFFGSSAKDYSPQALSRIIYGYQVDFQGSGELLKVISRPHDGYRDIQVDSTSGFIATEKYDSKNLPSAYIIQRSGDHPGLIALTFDDGPDPKWTPKILDILRQENVPATFFVIGKNGQAYPDLIRRMMNEGHEVGNHTFTHPNLGEIPVFLTDLELNATQRLIESITGRSTILCRPPFFGDAEADKPEEVEPAYRAQELGYIVVGLRIDPDDWKLPIAADDIVQRTLKRALDTNAETRGQVVLLHDSGGDRSATVEALPKMIHELRARGFKFVLTSELAGISRDQAMPLVSSSQSVYTRADSLAFFVLATGAWLLQWTFLIGIILGLGRLIVIGALAFAQWIRSRRRQRLHAGEAFAPFVSIIVPAFNEEMVIEATLRSLMASNYEQFEIIVVDDGSKDRTSDVVREKFGNEPRVRLFTEPNAGKANALNHGLQFATGEIVIALDADTVFATQTIAALAHRFYDAKLGAVAGNAKVGNRINIVTRWQALEYITSQNMDRRAFASLNCITVVPGAVGAWRRDLLTKAGGFTSDTLAEDQDLTLRIRRLGYTIGYEENAIAWTEAPATLRTLAKQRFRWAYGTLQCMWKHADALFKPRYGALGFVAMPNVWVFQIIFPLVSPVMDLMLVYTLLAAATDWLQQPSGYSMTNLSQIFFYYALFLTIDWLSACFAFILEKQEQWRLLWWIFLQRFCYRQVMYYVMIKSVATAIRGAVVGWGKLERKATVEAQP
jgi:cellulose synthase/poly-beta-1,6-N-acetylglucosamine synthase-like glycosyltransferase/peptidoglycan/xylan/chitin deacetylase (PgdA/CDA1 family)/spore germination protein YaaH